MTTKQGRQKIDGKFGTSLAAVRGGGEGCCRLAPALTIVAKYQTVTGSLRFRFYLYI